MSYVTQMSLRMTWWCIVPACLGAVLALPISAVLNLSATLGHVQPTLPDLD
jgi:hypothetical protein